MPTAYTSNKKIGGLDAASVVAGTDSLVVEKSGDTLRATVNQLIDNVFAAKTSGGTPANGDVVVIRRGADVRQLTTENLIPAGAIANAQISNSAAIVDTKLAKITTPGSVGGGAITDGTIGGSTAVSTSGNIATSGNISTTGSGTLAVAGNATVTGTLGVTGILTATGGVAGTATQATQLATGRTISTTGDVTYTSGSFNGTANVTGTATIANDAVTFAKLQKSAAAGMSVVGRSANSLGDFAEIAAGTDGHVLRRSGNAIGFGTIANSATTATNANTANTIVARDASGNFSAQNITANLTGNITGNASGSAASLATGRTIALTGDVTGTTGAFNGLANVSAATTLANSGVAAGTYNNNAAQVRPFTVDAKGRITSVGTAVPIEIPLNNVTGSPYKAPVTVATTAAFTTALYNNGSSGVGATLTNGTVGALAIDGVSSFGSNARVLIKDQVNAAHNGIYTVTSAGNASAAWVLTRAADADTSTEIGGAVVVVSAGPTNGGKLFTTDFRTNLVVGTGLQNWREVFTVGAGNGVIVDADINSSAAIAGTKVSPAFGNQNITVSTANRSITNTGNFALSFGTNNAERVRITNSGNVSIGAPPTTSPAGVLHVQTTGTGTNGVLTRTNDNTGSVEIRPKSVLGGNNSIVAVNDQAIIFHAGSANTGNLSIAPWAAGTSGIRITNSGNIGLGTMDQFGGGTKVIGIGNATALPTSNPADGGILYVENGALKYRSAGGKTTTLATNT